MKTKLCWSAEHLSILHHSYSKNRDTLNQLTGGALVALSTRW